MRLFILDDLVKQLSTEYGVDIYERNFVRGVYDLAIANFAKGIYSDLKAVDQTAYALKELEFLEKLISNKEQHLKSSLEHLTKARKQQIIIFLDNVTSEMKRLSSQLFSSLKN